MPGFFERIADLLPIPEPLAAPDSSGGLPEFHLTPIGRLILPTPPGGLGWFINLIRALLVGLALFGLLRVTRPQHR